MINRYCLLLLVAVGTLLPATDAPANPFGPSSREEATVNSAIAVLNEVMAIPAKRIPASMLSKAEGIAIVPGTVKVGFVGAVQIGRGVVLTRDSARAWGPPQFITMTGGGAGFQAGLQSTDIVLVFQTRRSIENLLRGKFTIGVDASAAAGPVGREAKAATDARLAAEIYSYSRSRGLFLGVSVDGAMIQVDGQATAAYYGSATVAGQPGATAATQFPPSALRLMQTVTMYSGPEQQYAPPIVPAPGTAAVVPNAIGPATSVAAPVADNFNLPASVTESLRKQLVESTRHLHSMLDANWRNYLALPADALNGQPQNLDGLRLMLARFDKVAANPQFASLAQRPEFRTTHDLLKRYVAALDPAAPAPASITLPPPPTGSVPG